MTCCPTCGQALPPAMDLVVDTARGVVSVGGDMVRMSPTELRVFAALLSATPRAVRLPFLLDAMYDIEADQPGEHIVRVYTSRLRKKLAHTGIVIESNFGFGYRLLLPPRPVARPVARSVA